MDKSSLVERTRTLWFSLRSWFTIACPTDPVAPVMVKMAMAEIYVVKLTMLRHFCYHLKRLFLHAYY
jgi:hypothetical protein